ncbi:MAG: Fic family protein [Desulfobacterales bacterium]
MNRKLQGTYLTVSTAGEKVKAFVPSPLPPVPSVEWTAERRDKFDRALLSLGRLDSVSTLLPDTGLFLYMYVRKEAVLSSMIEGTQSSLSDLLMFELEHQPGVPLDDVREVSNYVTALNHGLKRLTEGFPLSLRLLKEIHGILLSKGRGKDRSPGEFRKTQNWIGGSRPGNAAFVPPPPDKVMECMGQLELFLHDKPEKTPVLLKSALAHVQFETIHPFLDGNGRLGRLLITLLLCSSGVLKEPMLYLSLYFKSHREQYYQLLNNVRLSGNWEAWIDFFTDAVIDTATQAVNTAKQLLALAEEDGQRIADMKRISGSAHLVHKSLLEHPMASPNRVQQKTRLSPATVNTCLRELENVGILKEITGKKRNRIYSYGAYIDIMNQGTELP